VNCVAFKPDNPNILVSCSDDKTIKMWDITSGSCVSTVKVDAGVFGVQCVTFNGTGDTIVAGCGNGKIFFIDAATSQVREPSLTGHRYVPSLSKAYFLYSSWY
jgi:WD40 repeat protein